MKFVLMPDSFKLSLASAEVCEIMAESIRKHFPESEIVSVPVADGGEGSADAFLTALGGQKEYVQVSGPYAEKIEAYYALLEEGKTAVIEMASAAGLALAEGRKNPEKTGTYGVGELILAAAKKGVKKIILGLGGSCTNDGGCGAAAACGITFFNREGQSFVPTGGSLKDIARIENRNKSPLLRDVEILVMCDIDNPMYGEQGAAYIFAPQKGADAEMVKRLDAGLRHLALRIREDLGQDVDTLAGGGAAGAMGAGMAAFFGARLQMGIETVLDTVHFEALAKDADYIFTGEGKFDGQSLGGKVLIGLARRTKRLGKNLIAVVGGVEDGEIAPAYDMGIGAVFSINRLPMDFSLSRPYSRQNLAYTMDNILRLLKM